ncbi:MULTISPECIES: hypothetical protein [unclassified Streptomyces]|uniref:hypothetical protein n=1 Tax=unclassified Streptomyces TaxID=2593676 RepID=UPI000A1E7216|nr:hypothetical protein [Streptomyces sp. 13-12-16]OSP31541.1 hypothetical protein B7767_38460 [Streptomyces sp. 13-12-16]
MREPVYAMAASAAVVAVAALRTMEEVARFPGEGGTSDADCVCALQEGVCFAGTTVDFASCPTA